MKQTYIKPLLSKIVLGKPVLMAGSIVISSEPAEGDRWYDNNSNAM